MNQKEKQFYEQLGVEIRCVRQFYGMKQKEFAKKLGIPKSSACEMENGKAGISAYRLYKIKKILPDLELFETDSQPIADS